VIRSERELTALQGTISGEVVLPGAPGYDTTRRPAIGRFHHVRPRAVVRCADACDVVETLAVARLLRLPVAVRGGGHCFAGRSSTTGIVLDVSPMDAVTVADGQAVVGGGTRLGPLYDALAAHGLTIPAGCGPTVGIAGLTLGGGFGALGRRYGLTCDHLAGARVVCGDGRVVDCDARREPDLFWALRGGGPGTAVVTALRFHPVPAPPTTVFHLAWPAPAAAAVVAAWPGWAPTAADELTATLRLVAPAEPDRPVEVALVGTVLDGDPVPLLDEFVRRAGAEPTRATSAPGSYREAKRSLAGLGGSGADQPGVRYGRSGFFRRPLPADAAAALAHAVVARRVPGERHEVAFTPWGGAYNRVPPDATAFAHRAEAYLAEVAVVTSGGCPARAAPLVGGDRPVRHRRRLPELPRPRPRAPRRGLPRPPPRPAAADPQRHRSRRGPVHPTGGTMPGPLTPDERERFLAEPHIAVVSVAADPDRDPGRPPLAVPIWYHYAPGGEVSFFTATQGRPARKTGLVRRAGALTITVQKHDPPWKYVSVECRVVGDDQPPTREQMLRIVERYLPPDAAAGMVDAELAHPASRLVVFTARPTRWVSFDFAEG
jgi:hypothetical protein